MSYIIIGVILAGGKSTRMGRDKGLLLWKGRTLIESIQTELESACREVLLISDYPEHKSLGISVYEDVVKGKGPAGGILTALEKSNSDYCLIVACDMPFLNRNLFEFLINNIDKEYDVITPVFNDVLQPLCSIYSKSCSKVIKDFINQEQLAMIEIIKSFNVKYLSIGKELGFFSQNLFSNINTAVDYDNLVKDKITIHRASF